MPSIPTATVSRLVAYLRVVSQQVEEGAETISSEHIAREAQVSAFQVRKDLSYFGRYGTRGTGYAVTTLDDMLRTQLGLKGSWNVAIVGMGRLGQALVDYPSLPQYGFLLRGAFDVDPDKIGRRIGPLTIQGVDRLASVVREREIRIGFVTVPADAAQDAADALGEAGVAGILNFAPTVINPPPGVHVEPVDFLAGLKRLSFYIKERRPEGEAV